MHTQMHLKTPLMYAEIQVQIQIQMHLKTPFIFSITEK